MTEQKGRILPDHPHALREWLRRVLFGIELPLAIDDRPYREVVRLVRESDASVRPRLLDATTDLLEELYKDVSLWSSDAAIQLFALAGAIIGDSSREGTVALQLAQFIQAGLNKKVPHDIILSAGSALLALRRHETPAFWRRVASAIGERSLPLVLEGMGRSAWDSLLNWLPEALQTPRAEHSLISLLPYFASIRTGDELLRLADRVMPLLSKAGKADLEAFFARASIERPRVPAKRHTRGVPMRDPQRQRHGGTLKMPHTAMRSVIKLQANTPVVGRGYFGARFHLDKASLSQYDGKNVNELFQGLLPTRHR